MEGVIIAGDLAYAQVCNRWQQSTAVYGFVYLTRMQKPVTYLLKPCEASRHLELNVWAILSVKITQ